MTDRTVLVTGCGSPVGAATALTFREQEWAVYATARDEDGIEALAEQGCQTDSLDVTDDREAKRVAKRIDAEAGRLDAVVFLAGGGRFGALEDLPPKAGRTQFDTTVFGFHRIARAVLPVMREAGDGTIVTVASALGRIPGPGMGVYSAANTGLGAMADSLRAEVDGEGVDVVQVEPAIEDVTLRDDGAAKDAAEVSARAGAEADGGEPGAPYAWIDDLLSDLSLFSQDSPFTVSPDRVATEVYDAAAESDPDPRYQVGGLASGLAYARILPDGVRDLIYRLVRRLP